MLGLLQLYVTLRFSAVGGALVCAWVVTIIRHITFKVQRDALVCAWIVTIIRHVTL